MSTYTIPDVVDHSYDEHSFSLTHRVFRTCKMHIINKEHLFISFFGTTYFFPVQSDTSCCGMTMSCLHDVAPEVERQSRSRLTETYGRLNQTLQPRSCVPMYCSTLSHQSVKASPTQDDRLGAISFRSQVF